MNTELVIRREVITKCREEVGILAEERKAIMESAEVDPDQKRRSTEISIRTKIIRDTIAAQSAKMVALNEERKQLLAKRDYY